MVEKPDIATTAAILEAVSESLAELGFPGWEVNLLLISHDSTAQKGQCMVVGVSKPDVLHSALRRRYERGPDTAEEFMVFKDDPNTSKH